MTFDLLTVDFYPNDGIFGVGLLGFSVGDKYPRHLFGVFSDGYGGVWFSVFWFTTYR